MRAWMLTTMVVLLVAGQIPAQNREAEDVYEFVAPKPHTPRYTWDKDGRQITNADFFCTECAKEKKIPARSRDEMKDRLETTKTFPNPMPDGRTKQAYGQYRLMEHPADEVLKFLFEENKAKDPIFIEDGMFRIFTDFGSFSTRKEVYPRREEELIKLNDIFPKVTEKTVVLKSHERTHLYLDRAHRVMNDFIGLTGNDASSSYMAYLGPYLGMDQKWEIYIFEKRDALHRFLERFLGDTGKEMDGICWHTLTDHSMVTALHGQGMEDVELNNAFTHRLSYNVMTGYRRYSFDMPAWLVLGYAHLMERRERTDFNTFIYGEGKKPDDFLKAKWKPYVRKEVIGNKVRSISSFADAERVNEHPPEEHPFVWSIVSFLMQKDQKAMGRFIDALKSKQQGEAMRTVLTRALKSTFDMSLLDLEEQWKAWVIATYPPN